MLYDFALDEYDSEYEDSKSKIIYAYFGLAIYHGQCLEKEFTNMIWLKKSYDEPFNSGIEFNKMVDEVETRKITMGQQINELKNTFKFSDEVVTNLNEVLKKRNYLAHDYFKYNIEKFSSNKGSREMLKYFTDFINEAIDLDSKLVTYTENYKKKLGITDELVDKIINNIRLKEKLKDN